MDLQNKLYWTYIIIYTKLRKFFLSLAPAGREQLAYEQKKKGNSIKWIRPCCGTIIRSTREINVICGDCDEKFIRA